MSGRTGKLLVLLSLVFMVGAAHGNGWAQEQGQSSAPAAPAEHGPQKMALSHAAMCEKIEHLNPVNKAIVFSVSIGQLYCYTSFEPVPQPTVIYHRWFHRDELSTQTRLRVYPPKWATYSVIQLRETDKGPWRVEVSDQNGRVFDVLRFSIAD